MLSVSEAYKNHLDMIEKPIKEASVLMDKLKFKCEIYSLDSESAYCEWHKDDIVVIVEHLYEDDCIHVTVNNVPFDLYEDESLTEYLIDTIAIQVNAKYPEWLREDD